MSATKNQNTLNLKFVVVTNISSSPWRTQSSYFIDVGHWPNRHCADVYYLPYYPGPSNLSITSTTLLIFFDSYLKLSWGIHTYLVRWFMIWWKVKLSCAVLLKMHYQKLWDLIIDKYSLYAFCGFWVIFLRFPGIEAFFLRFRGFQAFILRFRGFQALFLRFCGFSNPYNPPPFGLSPMKYWNHWQFGSHSWFLSTLLKNTYYLGEITYTFFISSAAQPEILAKNQATP